MWPLISSPRIASACSAASSGVSANFTPPAFMRPPVRTCDLITVGPPISWAMRRASSRGGAKPWGGTGVPALAPIFPDSYLKNLIGGGPPISWAMRRASSGEVAKPWGETGMPALATIFRDSYSKNLMGGGSLSWAPMRLVLALILLLAAPASAFADVTLTDQSGGGV